ncbi:hypothetical protein MRX96_039792 [Rhipicephalus microplus]
MVPIRESRDMYQRGATGSSHRCGLCRHRSSGTSPPIPGHASRKKTETRITSGPTSRFGWTLVTPQDNSGSRESKTKSSGDSVVTTTSWQPCRYGGLVRAQELR